MIALTLILFIPEVNSYIKGVPEVRNIIDSKKEEPKVDNTRYDENDGTSLVSILESGYRLKIYEASLNGDKLILKGSISGPAMAYKDGIIPANIEILTKDFKVSEIEGYGNGDTGQYSGETCTFNKEEDYKPGAVKKFLDKSQEYLMVDVMVYRSNEDEAGGESRRVYSSTDSTRDYEFYWKEVDEAVKEFKSVKIPLVSVKQK
jgi:hypothetical protein